MSLPATLQRRAAVLAVVSGFGVFAAALGGMASVDQELRAVAPLRASEFVTVSDRALPTDDQCQREERPSTDLAREL